MSDELRVITACLHELAAIQERAARELAVATALTSATPPAVRTTHGVAASATCTALAALQAARTDAGTRMAAVAQGLGRRLGDSAGRYDGVDEVQRAVLDQQIPGRSR